MATKFAAGCETKCLGDANAAALTPGAPLLSCTKATCLPACKDSKDPECVTDCMTEKCGADFFKCLDGGTDGAGICGDILGCADGCDGKTTGKFSCFAACFDKTSKAGKKDFQAFMTCSSGPNDPDCGKEVVQCITGGKTGAKKCGEAMDCADKCDEVKGEGAKVACVGKCAAEVEAASTLLFIGAANCGGTFTADCGPVLAKCLAPTGTDKCGDITKCVGACKDGDDACVQGCIAKGSEQSASDFFEFALGCDADLPTCAASFLTCMAPDGADTCAKAIQCVSDCPKGANESSCVQACVMKVKATSAALLGPALTCGAKKDATSTECKAALGKCVTDN